jgi:hypothetical protein
MGNGQRCARKGTSLDGIAKNGKSVGKLLLLPVERGQQGSGW